MQGYYVPILEADGLNRFGAKIIMLLVLPSFLLGDLGKNISCSSQLLEVACIPWLMAPAYYIFLSSSFLSLIRREVMLGAVR